MKNLKLTGLVIILSWVTTLVFPQQTGTFVIHLKYNGDFRTLAFNVPLSYNSQHPYPLIIAMHQGGSNGVSMREMMNPAMHQIDAILVCPDNPDIQDYGIITAAVNYCKSNYNIDLSKIIITGYSFGGYTATAYAFNNYDKILGLINIAPAIYDVGSLDFSKVTNFSNAIIVGSEDDFISETTVFKSRIETNNGQLKYIEKAGVGHMDPYFSSLDFTNDWLDCFDYIGGNTSSVINNESIINFNIIYLSKSGEIEIVATSKKDNRITISAYNLAGKEIITPQEYLLKSGRMNLNLKLPVLQNEIILIRAIDENGNFSTYKIIPCNAF
jgi:dienelactone hydrolase